MQKVVQEAMHNWQEVHKQLIIVYKAPICGDFAQVECGKDPQVHVVPHHRCRASSRKWVTVMVRVSEVGGLGALCATLDALTFGAPPSAGCISAAVALPLVIPTKACE